MRGFLLQHRGLHAVPLAGINHHAARLGISLRHVLDFLAVLGDDLDNRDAELRRELEIAVVMRGHAHDGPRTVIRQHVVGQPNRHLGPV